MSLGGGEIGDRQDALGGKRWVDIVVDRRRLLAGLVILSTAILALFIPSLHTETSLKSVVVTSGAPYQHYEKFLEAFGNDDLLLVAMRNQQEASDPGVLAALAKITSKLGEIDNVTQAKSLSNLKFFQKKGDLVGMYPVLQARNGVTDIPAAAELKILRTALPMLDLLISEDLKSLGIVVRLDARVKHDAKAIRRILDSVRLIVAAHLPSGSEYRVVGAPVIRQAIKKYSIRTAVIFGILCTIISLLVTSYVFKNITITFLTFVIISISVTCVLGLMAAMKIPLSATTSIAFGLIIITTTLEMVIHIVVRFRQFSRFIDDRVAAARATVRYLVRPFIMCSATTAVGFGTCVVSDVPIVTHLGVVMPVGIAAAWCISLILTPYFLLRAKSAVDPGSERVPVDPPSPLVTRTKEVIAKHYRTFVIIGFLFSVVMLAGIPLIHVESQLARQLKESNQEVQDVKFVERILTPPHYVELMLDFEDRELKKPSVWKKVKELEDRLRLLPEVVAIDSYLPLLEHAQVVIEGPGHSPDDLWTNPKLIPQLRFLMSLSPEGKAITSRYVNQENNQVRISVRIKNSRSALLLETLEQVRSTAETVMKSMARPTVTGELALVAYNGANLVRSEIHSMALGMVIIAVLMMIQMGSPLAGLLSLIPSIPPLAAVFGVMGWLNVHLDSITVFAANVALGLAVDNTIQYVAQLKREIRLHPEASVQTSVFEAYSLAARPMASWSFVIALGFLSLLASPFLAPVHFGLLVSFAIVMGMFGDLIFLPSTILLSTRVRGVIQRVIEKETARATSNVDAGR